MASHFFSHILGDRGISAMCTCTLLVQLSFEDYNFYCMPLGLVEHPTNPIFLLLFSSLPNYSCSYLFPITTILQLELML